MVKLAAPPRLLCTCHALPRSLLLHLADSSDDVDHRRLLREQVAPANELRARRAAATLSPPVTRRGPKPLHRQVFDAGGQTLLPGRLLRDEDDPPTADKDADQTYEHVGVALQFFKEVLGRDSADGRGMRIDSSVHYGFQFANAMWTGEQIIVGDGDGRTVRRLARSLGLIAHEFCHAVTQSLVRGGLGVVRQRGMPPTLKGEAGALNESFCDVFASMIKQWHAREDVERADWLLGEDVLRPSGGKAIRSLKDPGNRTATWARDDQVKDYRRISPMDPAHKASGVGNRAFYLAAREIGGHSWEALAAVWLRGFDRLYSKATYLDAAHATSSAAASLHGSGSRAHRAVKEAWRAVHVLT